MNVTLDAKSFEQLQERMTKYGAGLGQIIDEVLHGEGAKLITDEIMRLLPVSGRRWSGKPLGAKSAMPFQQKNDSLSVTIHTKKQYNYLYFPDDGTNTRRHAGERYFMNQGAENVSGEIINLCVKKLIDKFEE